MSATGYAIVVYRSARGDVRGVATIPVRLTPTRVVATGGARELCTDERGGVEFGFAEQVWDRATRRRVPRLDGGWRLMKYWAPRKDTK